MATQGKQVIRVKLAINEGSTHRGIGFYANHLTAALKKIPDIELVEDDPDLIHYPFFDLFYPSLPLIKLKPTVVTIHDVTPLVLTDLYPQGIKAKINLWRQKISLQSVNAIVTDSQNSALDITQHLNVSQEKIFVAPLGVDEKFFQKQPRKKLNSLIKRLNLPPKFVLTVAGGPNPNKNLVRLAQATKSLEIPLVIVGKGMLQPLPQGKVHAELKDLSQLNDFQHIILPGFIPDEDLVGLYQLANVYCQASLYEGFGLPLLEAMAAGCLIVSANTSSLPEIYPPNTSTFDPYSVREIAQSLNKAIKLATKSRQAQVRANIQRARQFSWENTALITATAYQNVYENIKTDF